MTSSKKGLKAIALIEAFKGLMSLVVGFGIHVLAGENLQKIAESIVSHAHLNPASHYPSVFIHAASSITDSNMTLIALGALAYSLVRFVEAYGLWKAFVWTEWFALVSGAIYLPFEIYEIISHPHMLTICVFLLNVIVVCYMASVLYSKRQKQVPST